MSLSQEEARDVILKWLGPQRASLHLKRDIDMASMGAVMYVAATKVDRDAAANNDSCDALQRSFQRAILDLDAALAAVADFFSYPYTVRNLLDKHAAIIDLAQARAAKPK